MDDFEMTERSAEPERDAMPAQYAVDSRPTRGLVSSQLEVSC
jgi:hypothetical protein